MPDEETAEPHQPTVPELQKALQMVSDEVRKEARLRGWCSEYEAVVDRINAELGWQALGIRLNRRTLKYDVTLVGRATQEALGVITSEFFDYVKAFKPSCGEAAVSIVAQRGQLVVDEPADHDDDAPLAYDGYAENGCNCEECRRERIIARDLRQHQQSAILAGNDPGPPVAYTSDAAAQFAASSRYRRVVGDEV